MKEESDYEAQAQAAEANNDKQLAVFFRELYSARQQQKLTQTELAARIGMPQSSLARIEAGHTNPNLKTLFKIANELNMQIVLHPKS